MAVAERIVKEGNERWFVSGYAIDGKRIIEARLREGQFEVTVTWEMDNHQLRSVKDVEPLPITLFPLPSLVLPTKLSWVSLNPDTHTVNFSFVLYGSGVIGIFPPESNDPLLASEDPDTESDGRYEKSFVDYAEKLVESQINPPQISS